MSGARCDAAPLHNPQVGGVGVVVMAGRENMQRCYPYTNQLHRPIICSSVIRFCMNHPDWNLLRAFLETADTGPLSAAARKLGQTQPTLSRHKCR